MPYTIIYIYIYIYMVWYICVWGTFKKYGLSRLPNFDPPPPLFILVRFRALLLPTPNPPLPLPRNIYG